VAGAADADQNGGAYDRIPMTGPGGVITVVVEGGAAEIGTP
jgi:hypothetical protein